jgi:protein-tyrosine phosphatase
MELFWIPKSLPGRIAVATRPRGGDWLADDMAAVRRVGVDVLVSLLEPGEIRELALESELEEAEHAGVAFRQFAIPDRAIPRARGAAAFLDELVTDVRNNRNLAIHCRMGLGRSPMIAAALLVLFGNGPDESWSLVERARGRAVPDTEAQRFWVRELARGR